MAHKNLIHNEVIALGMAGTMLVHVRFSRMLTERNDGEREVWTIRVFDESVSRIGDTDPRDTVSGPVGGILTPLEALSSALSFLIACAEATNEEAENYHLFCNEIRELAEQNSDELINLQMEIQHELEA